MFETSIGVKGSGFFSAFTTKLVCVPIYTPVHLAWLSAGRRNCLLSSEDLTRLSPKQAGSEFNSTRRARAKTNVVSCPRVKHTGSYRSEPAKTVEHKFSRHHCHHRTLSLPKCPILKARTDVHNDHVRIFQDKGGNISLVPRASSDTRSPPTYHASGNKGHLRGMCQGIWSPLKALTFVWTHFLQVIRFHAKGLR